LQTDHPCGLITKTCSKRSRKKKGNKKKVGGGGEESCALGYTLGGVELAEGAILHVPGEEGIDRRWYVSKEGGRGEGSQALKVGSSLWLKDMGISVGWRGGRKKKNWLRDMEGKTAN